MTVIAHERIGGNIDSVDAKQHQVSMLNPLVTVFVIAITVLIRATKNGAVYASHRIDVRSYRVGRRTATQALRSSRANVQGDRKKDRQLLSINARNEMLNKKLVQVGPIESVGLGIVKTDWGNVISYWHDGGAPGYLSLVRYFPYRDLMVVSFVN